MPKIGRTMAHFRLDDGFASLSFGITELLQRLLRVAASLISQRGNQRDGRRRVAIQLEDLKKKQAAENEINWITASFMMLFHVGAIVALFFFTWKAFFIAVFFWWLATRVGIGMCYHRLLTHRGYKTPKGLEYAMTVCATLALEGGPIFWVATHRLDHQLRDA